MRTQHLVLLPTAALLVWASLAAADLPAVATVAGVAILLAAYGYLSLRLVSAEQRIRQLSESARLGEEAVRSRRLAITDPTNDLLARWYFELRVEEEVLRCLRYDEEMAVLVLRPPQDQTPSAFAAQEAAGLVLRSVRKTDLVGSLEDSFGVCLIHCDGPRPSR